MSLPDDLLEQAEHLARRDPRRPKQASLRRAVSATYYALFHPLSSATSALFAVEPGLAARINRTLGHAEMRKASQMVAAGKIPAALQDKKASYADPADLVLIAKLFVDLQDYRHLADYDLSRVFRREEVHDLVLNARQAFEARERVRKTDDARVYLACFLPWKRRDDLPR